MAKVTIKKARKILGKLAENVSDEQLEIEIKAAEFLKELYFSHAARNKTNSNLNSQK